MDPSDDRRDSPLPVTNEVGSEGGSYADRTMQVETFEEDEKRHRAPGYGGVSSVSNYAIRGEDILSAETNAGGNAAGIKRYPTEAPPDADEGRRSGARLWRSGLVGAAAGLAVGLLIGARRER